MNSEDRQLDRDELRYTQSGFTLVEALVALVVLSVGLLGVAKLVLGAVHADDSAYMRGQATQLAYELLDEMRANRPGAIAFDYNGGGAGTFHDCTGGACTALQLAQLDLFNFNNRVNQTLPACGQQFCYALAEAVDAVGDTTATITVSWDDSLAQSAFGGGGALQTVQLESVL
jgi:type IV pilus assembly protein PilV